MPNRPPDAHRSLHRGDARTALLDEALNQVRRQGWAATSVDQLCKAVGVTKGAFFHHFATKDDLGVAAAQRWTDVTSPLFASAKYHDLEDPLDRILGYLDFRASLTKGGPLESFTCFLGTTVQESFATSDPIRKACDAAINVHVATLVGDLGEAIARHRPRDDVTARSLARYTQSVIQGGYVLSKAEGSNAPVVDAIAHLKRYFTLLFQKKEEDSHGDTPGQLHLVRADDHGRDSRREVLRRGGRLEDRRARGPAGQRHGLPRHRKK